MGGRVRVRVVVCGEGAGFVLEVEEGGSHEVGVDWCLADCEEGEPCAAGALGRMGWGLDGDERRRAQCGAGEQRGTPERRCMRREVRAVVVRPSRPLSHISKSQSLGRLAY